MEQERRIGVYIFVPGDPGLLPISMTVFPHNASVHPGMEWSEIVSPVGL